MLYILPKINTFEFTSFRDSKIDIEKLKCKVMGIREGVMMTKGELIKAGVQPEFFKGYYNNRMAQERKANSVQRANKKTPKLISAASLIIPEKADIEKYKTKAALRKMRKMPSLLLPH